MSFFLPHNMLKKGIMDYELKNELDESIYTTFTELVFYKP